MFHLVPNALNVRRRVVGGKSAFHVVKVSVGAACKQGKVGPRLSWKHMRGCTVCNDQDFADVTDDAVSLYFMKTKLLPLGMSTINKARVRRVCKRYRWDPDLELLLRSASGTYGDRIEPKANERAEVIREIHKFGHLGVNKVQSAVVESYFWRGMNDDIRAVIWNCPSAANKQHITVVEPLRPTQLPLQAFDLVAND